MTPSQVAERLSERDLAMMMQYQARYLLPTHRLQKQLALIAKVTLGGNVSIDDLMVRYRPEVVAPASDAPEAMVAASFFAGITGGKVRVLGLKRKAREALH